MTDEKNKFGELKILNMRDAWKHEAHDFTPWLKDNISELGKALGLDLEAKNAEEKIGRFYLDLLAQEKDGRIVAIENQFNSTDHSHLGQLLTYAAGSGAQILIWVTEYVQEEHQAAIEWLNRRTDTETEFYLVKVEVLQIDNSMKAYKFIPVVIANQWQKETHEIMTVKSPKDVACGKYFYCFMEDLSEKNPLLKPYRNHKDSTRYRFFSLDVREWVLVHEFDNDDAIVYLYFQGENKKTATMLRNELLKQKESLTSKIEGLEWDGWSYSCIGVSRDGSFMGTEKSVNNTREWAVDNMIKFAETFSKEMLKGLEKKVTEKHNEK